MNSQHAEQGLPTDGFFIVQTQFWSRGYGSHVHVAELIHGEWPDIGTMLRALETEEGFAFGARWLGHTANGGRTRFISVYID